MINKPLIYVDNNN